MKKKDYGEYYFPEDSSVASANECTGLMPTPPENAYENESYQDLSPMEIPKKAPSRKEIREGIYDKPEPKILN